MTIPYLPGEFPVVITKELQKGFFAKYVQLHGNTCGEHTSIFMHVHVRDFNHP